MKSKRFGSFDRRDFIKTVAVAGAGVSFARSGMLFAAESAAKDAVAVFTAREAGKLKLLALTDIHFFEKRQKLGKDEQTLSDIRAMIKSFNPELIVLSGDLWFEDAFSQGLNHCKWASKKMGELGIPWAFNWGNHDTSEDHKKCHPIITGAANSLYRGTLYDGSYRIEIRSPGQQAPFWNLIIVNNAMPVSGFQQKQIKWFNAEAARIKEQYPTPPPAFMFFHVPLVQFREAAANGFGVKGEPVNIENTIPEAFDAIRESGMVKAVFCGHDHANNFTGMVDGIRLQYLRATGHSSYGAASAPKGGTIITIDATGPEPVFDAVTVFADGKTWELNKPLG